MYTPPGNRPISGVSGERLAEAIAPINAHVQYYDSKPEAAHYVADSARAGDVIVTMGAGDVNAMGETILQLMSERALHAH